MKPRIWMVAVLLGLFIPIQLIAQDSSPLGQRVEQLEGMVQKLQNDVRTLETRLADLEAQMQTEQLRERAGYSSTIERETIRSLEPGMTMRDIRSRLGPPHAQGTGSFRANRDSLTWRYQLRLNQRSRTLILVFENETLIEKYLY